MTAERERWKCRRFPSVVRKELPTHLTGSEMGAARPHNWPSLERARQEHNGANGEWLFFEEAADPVEDLGVHGGSNAAGLRVLLAGVVDPEETRRSGGDFCFGAVGEFEKRAGSNDAALLKDVEVAVPSDFSQCEDRLRLEDF